MITDKKINVICVAVIVLAMLFTIIFMNGESLGMTVIEDGDTETASDSMYFTTNDINASWNTDVATKITLEGDDAKISGSGAYFMNGDLYITQRGYYVITGELDDGSIIVSAKKSSKIWIMLNGVKVKASDDAAFRVDQAKKVFLTLAEGSVNTFTDGTVKSEEAVADETSGCIYAHDNLAINGSGKLTVNGNYSHGIVAKDNLVIAGGNITVNAQDDGIRANGALKIRDASIEINCYDDGLVVNKAEGYMYIMSGTIDIISGDDAVHSAGDIEIDGGTFSIYADDDGLRSDTNVFINGGTVTINECKEGIEAIAIVMTGGDVTIYPEDDGLNANGGSGDMFAAGGLDNQDGFDGQGGPGNFGSSSGEGGFTPPEGFDGQGGPGNFGSSSGEGGFTPPEGFDVQGGPNMAGFSDNAGSDGADAAGESADSADTVSSADSFISISGGTLTIINSEGIDCDGLDSNGSIYISGGDIRISLPGSGTNAAIDFGSESNGVCEISGGTVIACGGSEMIEAFDSISTQCSILYYVSGSAGSTVSVADASGNVLISYDVPLKFTSANISCPELKTGETYTISAGSKSEEVTIEEVVTTLGSSGNSSGGFSGMPGDSSDSFPGMPGNGNGSFPGGSQDGRSDQQETETGSTVESEDSRTQAPTIVFSGESRKNDDTSYLSDTTSADINEPLSWGMIGASCAAIMLGLGFAAFYRKRY